MAKVIVLTPAKEGDIVVTVTDTRIGNYLFPKGYEFTVNSIVTDEFTGLYFYVVKPNKETLSHDTFTFSKESLVKKSDLPKRAPAKKTTVPKEK